MTADPVGLSDIADRLGVARQTAKQWRLRGLLPEPSWTVSGSPAWDWPSVADWARNTGRLHESGKPPVPFPDNLSGF